MESQVHPPERADQPRRLQPQADLRALVLRGADHRDDVPGARRRREGQRLPQVQAPAGARGHQEGPGPDDRQRLQHQAEVLDPGGVPPHARSHRRPGVHEQDRIVHDQAGHQEVLHGGQPVPPDRADQDRVPEPDRHDLARLRRWPPQVVQRLRHRWELASSCRRTGRARSSGSPWRRSASCRRRSRRPTRTPTRSSA